MKNPNLRIRHVRQTVSRHLSQYFLFGFCLIALSSNFSCAQKPPAVDGNNSNDNSTIQITDQDQSNVAPVCKQITSPGPCKAMIASFHFDGTKCVQSYWGGCEGIRPFPTLEDCQKTCEGK